jgi:hypothetical protein
LGPSSDDSPDLPDPDLPDRASSPDDFPDVGSCDFPDVMLDFPGLLFFSPPLSSPGSVVRVAVGVGVGVGVTLTD